MQVIQPGPEYWQKMLEYGKRTGNIGYTDQHLLEIAIDFAKKGNVPCGLNGKVPLKTMIMIKSILEVKEKIESLGVTF